jgi:hypothetical protein
MSKGGEKKKRAIEKVKAFVKRVQDEGPAYAKAKKSSSSDSSCGGDGNGGGGQEDQSIVKTVQLLQSQKQEHKKEVQDLISRLQLAEKMVGQLSLELQATKQRAEAAENEVRLFRQQQNQPQQPQPQQTLTAQWLIPTQGGLPAQGGAKRKRTDMDGEPAMTSSVCSSKKPRAALAQVKHNTSATCGVCGEFHVSWVSNCQVSNNQ